MSSKRSAGGHADHWELADAVTRLRRALRSSVRTDIPWESLPMAQVEILQRLSDEPGLRIRDIADRHHLAPNTVSNLVQQMVTEGLVDRQEDSTDRRAVVLALTPAGATRLRDWQRANDRRIADALAELDADDRTAILAAVPALRRLIDRLGR